MRKEFRIFLFEQNEDYLDYIEKEEESISERIPNKQMEHFSAVLLEDVRHERSVIILLSLTDPDILRQNKFTDFEIDIIKILTLEKLHRQRSLKEHIAMSSLESQVE